MIPLPYNEIDDWEDLTIELDNGNIIGGRFTNMRINRDTIPRNLCAYDLRSDEDDADDWFCQIKDFVLVNHAGTFVTETKIDGTAGRLGGQGIKDYSFCPIKEYDT